MTQHGEDDVELMVIEATSQIDDVVLKLARSLIVQCDANSIEQLGHGLLRTNVVTHDQTSQAVGRVDA